MPPMHTNPKEQEGSKPLRLSRGRWFGVALSQLWMRLQGDER